MEQRRNIKLTGTHEEQGVDVNLSLDYSFTSAVLEVPLNHRTVPVGLDELPESERPADSKVMYSRIVEIEDPRFEETYTAYVTKTSTGWIGRIPDVPEVNKCKGKTEQALLAALKDSLHEVLKARSDAWDKQIEEDIKARRLDHLREEALEDVKAGRFNYL